MKPFLFAAMCLIPVVLLASAEYPLAVLAESVVLERA
jgi:hypothetical protein